MLKIYAGVGKDVVSLKNLKIWLLFLIGLPVFLIGRTVALYTMIDPATGFFYSEYHTFHLVYSLLLAGFCVLLLILCLLDRKTTNHLQSSPVLGVGAFLMALVLLIQAANALFTLQFSVLYLLQLLCYVLSALAFCIYGIWHLTGYNKGKGLLLFPILLWILRLISVFIEYTGIANISENVLTLLAIAASTVFLLFHGKLTAGIATKTNYIRAMAFGLPASLLCLLASLPRYLLFFSGNSILLHNVSQSTLLELAMGIYILLFFLAQPIQKVEE